MKRHRTVNEGFPRLLNPKGKKLCRYCGRRLLKGRQRKWCSFKCAHQAYIRCQPSAMRRFVWERDKGKCRLCGFDIKKMQLDMREYRGKAIDKLGYYDGTRAANEYGRQFYGARRGSELHSWEADHIEPISEAGDAFDPANVRVLCLKCHKEETAKLRKRLAIRRKRHSFKPLFPQEVMPA